MNAGAGAHVTLRADEDLALRRRIRQVAPSGCAAEQDYHDDFFRDNLGPAGEKDAPTSQPRVPCSVGEGGAKLAARNAIHLLLRCLSSGTEQRTRRRRDTTPKKVYYNSALCIISVVTFLGVPDEDFFMWANGPDARPGASV